MARIAVITPYHSEPLEYLDACHRSVLAQEPRADHFMVADGIPNDTVATWNVRHVVLPSSHGDGGATARGLGSLLADSEGYDFIAFLDADNWYLPGHLASMVRLHEKTGAPVCTCLRTFHRPDGSPLPVSEPAEDQLHHVDTSCFFLHRAAFEVLPVWSRMPSQLWRLCDRVFLAALRHARFAAMSTRERTVAYRTLYEAHYAQAGLPMPEGVKPNDILKPAIEWLKTQDGVTECVRRLGFWPASYL